MANNSRKNIETKDQKIIWGQSAGMCAICKTRLIVTASKDSLEPIGEMAHIEGEKPKSKRYNPEQTDKERKSHKNLILLCPNDHTIIDRDDDEYTVQKLIKIKNEHILFVVNSIRAELPNLTFAELQVIVSFLVSPNASYDSNDSLNHITPKDKIDKNGLSPENANLITMGMSRVKQVKDYLNTNPDVSFSERLRSRLADYYNKLKKSQLDSNIIFSDMLCYMSEESSDFKKKAAALAVLTYFFETCDIFEK